MKTTLFDGPCAIEGLDPTKTLPPFALLATNASYELTPDGPVVWADDGYTIHELHLAAEPEVVGPGLLQATAATGVRIKVRAIDQDDGMIAIGRGCPLPADAIVAAVAGGGFVPGVQALTDDEGDVVTLMVSAESGLWTRFSGIWNYVPPGQDPDPLDGFNVFDVDDAAVNVFDQADRAGQQVSIAAMPLAEGETLDGIVLRTDVVAQTEEAATTASAEVLVEPATTFVTIRRREDLPAAIAAAVDDPGLRWYVERRAEALRADVSFPWRES